MSEILQRLVTYAVKALTPTTHGKQTTLLRETLEARSQQPTVAATPQGATSPSFNTDLLEEFVSHPETPYLRVRPYLYEYSCKFCGVKLTTTYTLTLAIRCPDHKVLLQSEKVSPK